MSAKKGFFQLLAGNIGVQIISLGFYPILSRIYSPTDFGIFGLLTSTVLVLGIFSCGQLHHLLPNPKKDEDAFAILRTVLIYNFIFCLVVSIVCEIFIKQLYPSLNIYVHFLGLFIFFYTFNQIFVTWFSRFRAYKNSSFSTNLNRFLSGGLKSLFPSLGFWPI
jgi:O-antigen/teichoic acid export membrane protein